MRRAALLAAAVATALALPGGAAALAARAPTTAVGVEQTEWRLTLFRTQVPTGRVRLNVANAGEDGHDLAVRRGGRLLGRLPELRPGERRRLTLRLTSPGRLRLVCTLPGHEVLGMRATLTVRRARRG